MIRHYSGVLFVLSGSVALFSQSVTLNPTPSKEVGQPKLVAETVNPNLVEGRELYTPVSLALDTSTTPPAVYVSDTGNNRVMGWKNATSFSNGQPADLIIGQTDPYSTGTNGSGTASGLNSPTGLAVDKNGNLYVADSGDNRILRYPKPFAQTSQFPLPDLVLGQPSFNSRAANYTGAVNATGISLQSNNVPFIVGVALDSNGNVWVVDAGNRRVLEFQASDVAGGGQGITAKVVLGQPDFVTQQTGLNGGTPQASLATNQFDIPAAVAFDAAGRLYVSDSDGQTSGTRLNRVLVFVPGSGGTFTNGQAAARIMGGGCLSIALNGGQCPALGSQAASEAQNNPAFPYNTLLPPAGWRRQSEGWRGGFELQPHSDLPSLYRMAGSGCAVFSRGDHRHRPGWVRQQLPEPQRQHRGECDHASRQCEQSV
jgi:sugar lactone lactonase YvrE